MEVNVIPGEIEHFVSSEAGYSGEENDVVQASDIGMLEQPVQVFYR